MFGGKKKKTRKAARAQSCLEHEIAPELPPRPPGGLPPRASISFDGSSSLTDSVFSTSLPPPSGGFPVMESPDIPPPVPSTPRPKIGNFRPPAPLPTTEEVPPPLPPPLTSPARQRSVPATPSAPSPSTPDPRYARGSGNKGTTPSISGGADLTEEQLRKQIEMQTQNTRELRKLLEGKEEEAMSPSALVGRYGKYFPFKAMVMKGFYNNRAEIVAGEIYNIHFLKNARVISIFDSSGERYVLPLNAAMRIGFEQPNQPPTYYNIVDLINTTEPPKLVSPCGDYRGSDGNSLKQDEVLRVKGVHVAKVRRSKSLVLVNVKTGQEKKIPSDCPVAFSTEPTYNQLTLSDLVNKVPELIPGKARLYPTVDVEDMGFPGHLVSETVKVKRHYQERSLISTLEEQEPRPVDRFSLATEPEIPQKTIYDIPLSLDIEFSIIPPEPEEDIYAYTHQLHQQFDPRKLQSGDGLGLNMALDEENIYSGVELELPPYMNYDPAAPSFVPLKQPVGDTPPPPLPARRPSGKHDDDSDDGEEYTEIDLASNPFQKHFVRGSSPSAVPPPLPSSVPPPLPSTLPPSTRPHSASRPPIHPRSTPSPPLTSPKPGKRGATKGSASPRPAASPHLERKASSVDDYVDMTDEITTPREQEDGEPPLSPLPPSLTPQTAAPQPVLPASIAAAAASAAAAAAAAGGGGGEREEKREVSPLSDDYDDTTGLAEELAARPRMPSPVTVSDSSDEDQEILQQLTDLQKVIQSARNVGSSKQQLSSPAHTSTELKGLREELKRVAPFPQKIINYLMIMEREVGTLSNVLRDEMVKTSSSEALQQNRQFLASLTVPQVIKMLEVMNMRKYQDRFAEEGIAGDVLCDIHESVLEENLGVTSKLDRIKLMKIIKGERSAKSVLEGQYNYVALQPSRS